MAATIRCAVLGCGVIAPVHLRCLRGMPEVEVTWVCDPDDNKARALSREFAVPNVAVDDEKVFAAADVDAVHICTDHASHAPLAVRALEAGKHVLCEKPLASDPQGLRAMLEAKARRPDKVFAPVFQHRYEPMMRALADIVSSGLLGKLVAATTQLACHRSREYYSSTPWRGSWATEGGSVLINQAVHFFDIMFFIAGGAKSAQAMFANLAHQGPRGEGGIETEDTLVASLLLENGALANFQATSASHLDWEPAIMLRGTGGSLDWRAGALTRLECVDPSARAEARRLVDEALETVERSRNGGVGKGYYGPGHPAQIADFIEAARGEHPPFVTAEMAAKTMTALFAVYESARSGKRVEIA